MSGHASQHLIMGETEQGDLSRCVSHSAAPWYVVQTINQMRGRTLGEVVARRHLTAAGFRVHLPLFAEWKRSRDGRQDVEVLRPLFPGYCFVQFDVADPAWRRIPGTIGVRRLFMSLSERPLAIAEDIVGALMAKGRPGDGVIDHRYTGPDFPIIAVGEVVRFKSGPFADLYGICRWSTQKRIALLLNVFDGTPTEVVADRQDVEATLS
jgi:transcriptional antiterminator RfaH